MWWPNVKENDVSRRELSTVLNGAPKVKSGEDYKVPVTFGKKDVMGQTADMREVEL